MNEARVFVVTLLVVRTDINGTELAGAAGASSILTVQTSHKDAEDEGWRNAHQNYPEADGWFGHQVTVFELPDTIETDGYNVTLTIAKSGDSL
jgi:hypothetical protein